MPPLAFLVIFYALSSPDNATYAKGDTYLWSSTLLATSRSSKTSFPRTGGGSQKVPDVGVLMFCFPLIDSTPTLNSPDLTTSESTCRIRFAKPWSTILR